ncbi:ankyrin repeat domain-containing protein [Agarilytica rhodophyticola]|uniref:ankyrin repeat domain-containing protein n=1 Tax=Agarilytica rhodophyticola TaxID=1737490 RepID=UPI000B3464CE|nr:ankyrin repeat domain-containing protein [Agarilytica rhodophyticola]
MWFYRLIIFCFFIVACDAGLVGEPPLHQAAYRGDVDEMKKLIKSGVSVDSLNSEGATPLHWAAFKGHLPAAKLLLRHGANVNAATKKGSTPLRLATTHKKQEVIKFLKSRGGK